MTKLSSKLNIAQPKQFTFGPAAANTFTTQAHGLGTDRLDILLERQVNTDEWEILDPGSYVTVDTANGTIVDQGLTALGTDTVRLKASTELGAFLSEASASQSGIVTTGAQTFAGDKTLTGSTTLSGGVSGDVAFDTDTLFVDSAGNRIGIETTTPASARKLTIKSDGTNSGLVVTNINDTIVGEFVPENVTTSTDLGIYAEDEMRFYNNSSRTMTLTDGGKVGFGESAPNAKVEIADTVADPTLLVRSTYTPNDNVIVEVQANSNSINNGTFMSFTRGSGNELGSITQSSTNSVFFNTSSDERLKTDFKDFNGLDLVNQLEVYDFSWKNAEDQDLREYGFKAQQAYEVIPSIVNVGDDGAEVEKPWGVDYGRSAPILAKAIQELSTDNDAKQTVIDDLLLRVAALETQ